MDKTTVITYAEAILVAHRYLLANYPEVIVIGQGLWSPWYVGATMTDLELEFGRDRLIDTPVSEAAVTGAAIGAALGGLRPIVVHPRVDFALLATDQIINQAAKWSSMFGGRSAPGVVIRCIINRGGEQGAQHSQALHSVFAHIPGLRVVMPSTPADAADLLVASVLAAGPVVYIDDRWLYEREGDWTGIREIDLSEQRVHTAAAGSDITLVGAGHSAWLNELAADQLALIGISAEAIDLRVVSPLHVEPIVSSVEKTGRLLVVDGDWGPCGLAGEVLASVAERLSVDCLRCPPRRITLPFAPAPTSHSLEQVYYPDVEDVCKAAALMVNG